jgi:POT family proton-dependent oligopeptide transporter
MAPALNWRPWYLILALCLVSVGMVLLAHVLLTHIVANDVFLAVLLLCAVGYVIYLARQQSQVGRRRLFAFLILSFISLGFWSLYTLEPSLLTVFIKTNVDRQLFGQLIPPSVFYGLDPLFVIVMGVVFGWVWSALERRKANPSLPAKFTCSLFSMSLGFFLFIVGIAWAGMDGLSSMTWVVLGYLFLSIAELLISPIGLAMVGRLSPEGCEGRLVGVWQLFTGVSGPIAGYLAQWAVVPKQASLVRSNPIYMHAFFKIGMITVVLGVLMWGLVPMIKRLMSEVS